jgi:hypothetical protein
MDAMLVVVIAQGVEFPHAIDAVREKRAIQEFAPDRADQSLNVWNAATGSRVVRLDRD